MKMETVLDVISFLCICENGYDNEIKEVNGYFPPSLASSILLHDKLVGKEVVRTIREKLEEMYLCPDKEDWEE